MNVFADVKKCIAAVAVFFISISVLSGERICYAADSINKDNWFIGGWSGGVQTSGGKRTVDLTIAPLTNGSREKTTLVYREPRGCTLQAELAESDKKDNSQAYIFKTSNGGFCDKLINGRLYLKKQRHEKISCVVHYKDSKSSKTVTEKGLLSRRGD